MACAAAGRTSQPLAEGYSGLPECPLKTGACHHQIQGALPVAGLYLHCYLCYLSFTSSTTKSWVARGFQSRNRWTP